MDMKKIGGIAKEVAGSGVLGPVAKGIAGLFGKGGKMEYMKGGKIKKGRNQFTEQYD
tara:strand:+ start:917 stop:1087 length:171 start_codon:yes stop_codon:yes gene_type:complete